MKRFLLILLLTSYILPLTPPCGAGTGTTGGQFLQIAPGARAVAMGEAFVARADDLTALWWNPAGLATLSIRELNLGYYRWFEEINYGFAGYGQSALGGTIAGGIITLQASGIPGTEETGAELGDLETPFYDLTRDWAVGDYAASLAYARTIRPRLNLGLTMKFIYSELADETAYGGAVDLGILYQIPLNPPLQKGETGGFTLGAVVQNIGPKLAYHDKKAADPLPLTGRIGFNWQLLSTEMNNLSVGADLNIPANAYLKIPNKIDTNIKLNLGAEYWFRKLIAARIGYKVNYDTDWITCGLGISFRGYQLDYAYAPFHTLGDTHRISFSLKF